jgi:hypothetical protein
MNNGMLGFSIHPVGGSDPGDDYRGAGRSHRTHQVRAPHRLPSRVGADQGGVARVGWLRSTGVNLEQFAAGDAVVEHDHCWQIPRSARVALCLGNGSAALNGQQASGGGAGRRSSSAVARPPRTDAAPLPW